MKLECVVTRGAAAAATLAAALALGGCATTGATNPRDPWEPFNRDVFALNEGLDRALFRPVATLYRDKVPPLVRTGVANFFGNLGDAWSAVNSLLQFRLADFEENLARFHINTMFGVFGIFDVASEFNIERHREDFGQTLGRWGVRPGPYMMLPILGPSTLRDTVALPVDWRYDLVRQIDRASTREAVVGLRALDKRANLLRVSTVLDEAALDKYSFTRDAYLQRRRAEIDRPGDAERAPPALPDESGPAPGGQPGAAPAR